MKHLLSSERILRTSDVHAFLWYRKKSWWHMFSLFISKSLFYKCYRSLSKLFWNLRDAYSYINAFLRPVQEAKSKFHCLFFYYREIEHWISGVTVYLQPLGHIRLPNNNKISQTVGVFHLPPAWCVSSLGKCSLFQSFPSQQMKSRIWIWSSPGGSCFSGGILYVHDPFHHYWKRRSDYFWGFSQDF